MVTLSRLHELKKRLDAHRPFPKEIIKNLDEWYKVELTYTSNAIEGNTLSRQETALVVEKGITVEGKSIVEHLEAINHAKAWDYIMSLKNKTKKNITERTIRDIHSLILRDIDTTNAGRYRNVPVRIAGSSVVMPNALKVPDLMKELIDWLHNTNNDIIDVALRAHYTFVSIHPFTDGNGRTARLLMNLILMQAGYPPAIIRKEDRKVYINSIEKGQLSGDLSDYIPLMFLAVERSVLIYLESLEPKEIIEKSDALLKIGELAKMTEETVPTIRFWTNEGLLRVKKYSPGGYQLYHQDMIHRVKQIRTLQSEKRLTIEELKKVIV
ncbi:MAG: Fic family protein [bacterium]|nr:Fic family protein [bacterium]